MDGVGIVKLEVDVFDDECPDFVAEPVGIEMSLESSASVSQAPMLKALPTHLERQSSLDLFRKHFRNRLVEVCENLHGELGLNPALGDEVVECVREGPTYTTFCQSRSPSHGECKRYLLRR